MSNQVENKTGNNDRLRSLVGSFRNIVEDTPNALFPAEKGRYTIYIMRGCPWASRTWITWHLKGLQDVINISVLETAMEPGKGWYYSGRGDIPASDPDTGIKYLSELYFRARPGYEGRFSVPVFWDRKKQTIVNNESSDIIRFMYTAFDRFLPQERRIDYYPQHLRQEIDEMNPWILDTISLGVYKTVFATTQDAYEANVVPIFKSLDRLESHLETHQPFLLGETLTDVDIRLFVTLIRFDVGYYTMFQCNLKSIRHDYPRLHKWLRTLYWDETARTYGAFKKSTNFQDIKSGYSNLAKVSIVPAGPLPHILPL